MGSIKSKKILSLLLVVMLFFLSVCLIFCSINLDAISNKPAYAAVSLSVDFNDDEFEYTEWFSSSFLPISTVLVNDDEEDDPQTINTYTLTLTNTENSSYSYTANVSSGSPDWGGQYPQYGGYYEVTVNATYGGSNLTYNGSEDLTLFATVLISSTEEDFSVVYDKTDYIDLDTHIELTDYFEINQAFGLSQSIEDYYLGYEWTHYSSEVKEVGQYDLDLYLANSSSSDEIEYLNYRTDSDDPATNKRTFAIQRRPMLMDPAQFDGSSLVSGSIVLKDEKQYDGTDSAANLGSLHSEGSGQTKYDYLLENSKVYDGDDVVGGLLASDLQEIKEDPSSFNAYWVLFDDSYFMDEWGNPSESVSSQDSNGNVLYDKSINYKYQLNQSAVPQLGNYYIVISDGEGGYIGDSDPPYSIETVVEEARIMPVQINIEMNTLTKEYGFRQQPEDLPYQLASSSSAVSEGNIGVVYSGDLMGETIGFYNGDSTYDIEIEVKIGRAFVSGQDNPSQVDFIGKTSSGEEMDLIEYTRYTPLVGNYYHYIRVYYDGTRVDIEDYEDSYQCGILNLNYDVRTFSVSRKQLEHPEELTVFTQKEYDGLLQADFTEYSFDDQWETDIYYVGETSYEDFAGDFIRARVRPVFNSPAAGTGKTIDVRFIIQLIDEGSGKDYLLNQYSPPTRTTIEDAIITKREMEFSFDMTNAQDAPLTHPELFPDGQMLIFEKAYGAEVPEISEFLYDPIYDGAGNVVYEEYYRLVP